ncbi:hypothetical protein KUCAC02_022627 [Chaenocephalus aceratus]|uniref:Uncharacterized protein n=1 Tax=Chaenocephalus aceratus TaxID=36190 RepID=A0ACB9XPE1_CHAAC|nr:hypothetical protein KUCAC02_022627 [Chaenocephalus aceratus]
MDVALLWRPTGCSDLISADVFPSSHVNANLEMENGWWMTLGQEAELFVDLRRQASESQTHPSPGLSSGLVMGHKAGHESEGVSGVLLLELSVKSELALWSARGQCTLFDRCV